MTIRIRDKLAGGLTKKLIAWDRSDLDGESIDKFIDDNPEDYKNMVSIFNLLMSYGIIYAFILLIDGFVIIPTLIPGLDFIQSLAVNLGAIIGLPSGPLLWWICAPRYRAFRKKLNEYGR